MKVEIVGDLSTFGVALKLPDGSGKQQAREITIKIIPNTAHPLESETIHHALQQLMEKRSLRLTIETVDE